MTMKPRSIPIGRLGLLCAILTLVLISSWSVAFVYAQDRGDKDGDGVPDTNDRCPDEPGPRENSGCPVRDPDSSGDGVSDSVDRCAREAGPADNGGCPRPAEPPPAPPPASDSDGDGLTDDLDRCPREFGSRESGGCPEKRSESGEETRDESAVPAPESVGPPPAIIPPLGEANGPCVAATSGSFNVNVRAGADPNAAIQGSLDPASVAPVSFAVSQGNEVWLKVEGGFVSQSVVRLGGDCASLWTMHARDAEPVPYENTFMVIPMSVSPVETAHRLAHVVQYDGQPVATIGGSQELTVGANSQADTVQETMSFNYSKIVWNLPAPSSDPETLIFLGTVTNSDSATTSGDLASGDCPLLPEMDGVTCQPVQPYWAVELKQAFVDGHSVSGSGLDASAEIDALAMMNTPLMVVPITIQRGSGSPLPAILADPIAAAIDSTNSLPIPGSTEFQDTWEQQTDTGGLPVVIGLPPADSGRGPSLLISGGDDLLIGGTTTVDQTVHVLQLFAAMDDTGNFWYFGAGDTAVHESTSLVHVAEIVVVGEEQVVILAEMTGPEHITTSVLPAESEKWIRIDSVGWYY